MVETDLISQAIRKNPREFRNLSRFDILTKLQHYGLGTRLLDVTLNPLIALYFACEECIEYKQGKDKRFSEVRQDGGVCYKNTYWHTTTEIEIKLAAELPFIDILPNYTLNSLCDHLSEHKIIDHKREKDLCLNEYQKLIAYIQSSYFVLPENTHERLEQQSGAFILPCCINIRPNPEDMGQSVLTKAAKDLYAEFDDTILIIPANVKQEIISELDFMGINESTVYPELEHQMNYIKTNVKVQVGQIPEFETLDLHISNAPRDDILQFVDNASQQQPLDSLINLDKVILSLLVDITPSDLEKVKSIFLDSTQSIEWYKKESIISQIKTKLRRVLQGTEDSKLTALVDTIVSEYVNASEHVHREPVFLG